MDDQRRAELQSWMIRLADGDRSAFEPLFGALLPLLERFARRSLGSGGRLSDEARDVAQESLLRVFSRAHEFDRERDALNWILGITAYQCKTFRKRRLRRREDSLERTGLEGPGLKGVGLQVRPRAGEGPEDAVITRDLLAAAEEVLGTLRESDVATLRAAFEGSRRPAVPPATFRKRLQRALKRLRLAWEMKHGSL